MKPTHVSQQVYETFEKNLEVYRAANLLKNPSFSEHLADWSYDNVSLGYESDNILAALGASNAEAWLSQSVENMLQGQYLAAFSYRYDEGVPDAEVQLLINDQMIGSFIIQTTRDLSRSHCFVVVDLEAMPSATFKLAKPFAPVPPVYVDDVWLAPIEAPPPQPYLVNGDFEFGSYQWKLDNAGVHPIVGGGHHLVLGATGIMDSSAEQKLSWARSAAGSYKLSFTIAPIFASSYVEKGEVSLTVNGIAERFGFEVEGVGKRTMEFTFEVPEVDGTGDLTLRIAKVEGGEGAQGWWVDDVQFERTPASDERK